MAVIEKQLKGLSIYELSEQIEVGVTTLKTWESFFNISVERNDKNARKYSEDNIKLFKLIKEFSSNGCSLNSIKSLLNQQSDGNGEQQQKLEIITESMPNQESGFNLDIVNKLITISKEKENLNRELGRLEGQLAKFNEILTLKDNQIQEKNSQIEEYKAILDELESESAHKWWHFWK